VRGYLADRYTRKAWTISEIAVELGVGEKVAKRLRRALGVTRSRATPRVAASARRGRARRAALVAGRRPPPEALNASTAIQVDRSEQVLSPLEGRRSTLLPAGRDLAPDATVPVELLTAA
jgi:hypothetical protein